MRKKAAVVGGASQYCDLPGTKCLVARWSLMLCVFVLAAFAHVCSAAVPSAPKNVLVLYSFTDRKAQDDLEILKSTTRSRVDTPVDFHVEYLGSARFDAPGYEKAVTESLASVYGGKKIDLVITVFYPALRFAVDHRQELFPGAPIVFSSVPPRRLEGQKLWPGVTGVTMDVDLQGTIDLALRLQPDTKNAAVVVGTRRNGSVLGGSHRSRPPAAPTQVERDRSTWAGAGSTAQASLGASSPHRCLLPGDPGRGGPARRWDL